MHAVDALRYVNMIEFINATTTTILILVNGLLFKFNFISAIRAELLQPLAELCIPRYSDLTIELFRIEHNGRPGLDLVLYNTNMVWECCIIQWYNITGIIPQLYIHTHSSSSHLREGVAELKRRGTHLGFCWRGICRRKAPASCGQFMKAIARAGEDRGCSFIDQHSSKATSNQGRSLSTLQSRL